MVVSNRGTSERKVEKSLFFQTFPSVETICRRQQVTDGTDYLAEAIMHEDKKKKFGTLSYVVTKIKVSDRITPNTSNGVGRPNSVLEAYPLANIMKDFGKAMEPNTKLLDERGEANESNNNEEETNNI